MRHISSIPWDFSQEERSLVGSRPHLTPDPAAYIRGRCGHTKSRHLFLSARFGPHPPFLSGGHAEPGAVHVCAGFPRDRLPQRFQVEQRGDGPSVWFLLLISWQCAIPKRGRHCPALSPATSRILVINAGDGGHQHPTVTMIDLTSSAPGWSVDNSIIGLCGDLEARLHRPFSHHIHGTLQEHPLLCSSAPERGA